MLGDAALKQAIHRTEVAGADDDRVVAALLGHALDHQGGIAHRLEQFGLEPFGSEYVAGLDEFFGMDVAVVHGATGERPGSRGTTLTTPILALKALLSVAAVRRARFDWSVPVTGHEDLVHLGILSGEELDVRTPTRVEAWTPASASATAIGQGSPGQMARGERDRGPEPGCSS